VAGHIENDIVIDAPMELVWEMTNDVESWPDLFSEYAAAHILERDGDTVRFRLTTHPDQQGNSWSWVSERTPDAARRVVTARRVEPGWFEYMNIRWTYEQTDSGVRMTWIQDFAMRPDSPVDEVAMTGRLTDGTRMQMPLIKRKVEAAALARESSA
jgi:aromatase